MRVIFTSLAVMMLAAPPLCAQQTPAATSSAAAAADFSAPPLSDQVSDDDDAPASTGSVSDPVDLNDIRYFSRVYEIARQAYVEKLDNKTLMKAAISGMLSGIDPHAEYLDKDGLADLDEDTSGQYSGLGIEVMEEDNGLRIIAPIDDTPASRAGIKPGDLIVKIDGKLVDSQNVDDMFKLLRGDPGSKVTLTILHEKSNTPIDVPLVREKISVTSVKVRMLEPGYAYIRISQFQEDTGSDLEKKLGELIRKNGAPKGAVLDLRSNPGGLLNAAVAVADDFLDNGTIVTTRGRLRDSNLGFSAHPGDQLAGAPIVLLVDNGTASAAEIVSGALKDNHRALLMGRRTFGKGVVQTVIPLDADHAVKITTARYYTPKGTSIQAEGIKPDIALPDIAVSKANAPASLMISEADLPNHLANESSSTGADTNDGSSEATKLATQDYALAQALNVLKGLALNRPMSTSAAPAPAKP